MVLIDAREKQIVAAPIERPVIIEQNPPAVALPFRKRENLLNRLLQRKRKPKREDDVFVLNQFFLAVSASPSFGVVSVKTTEKTRKIGAKSAYLTASASSSDSSGASFSSTRTIFAA